MCFWKKKAKKAEEKKEEKKVEQPKEKPAPAKAEPAPKAKPAEEPEEKKAPAHKSYHVVKRQSDGMWEVKFAGGQKAIKLFKTQAEAIEYTKKLAENQDGAMLVHNSKGANKGRIKAK